jgi:hypothetical protein
MWRIEVKFFRSKAYDIFFTSMWRIEVKFFRSKVYDCFLLACGEQSEVLHVRPGFVF